MRLLTASERHAILALAAEFSADADRAQLLLDLAHCTVEEKVPDGSLLVFDISGYDRPSGHKQSLYPAKHGFRAEGSVKDADGIEMDVLLFADQNNRVYELEIVKHLPGSVIEVNWATFKVK